MVLIKVKPHYWKQAMKSLENGDIIRSDDERFTPVNKWQIVPAHWVGTSYRKTINGPVRRASDPDQDEGMQQKTSGNT